MTSQTPANQKINAHYVDVLKRFSAVLVLGMLGAHSPATVRHKMVWLRRFFRDLQLEGYEVIHLVGTDAVRRNLMKNQRKDSSVKEATMRARIKTLQQLHKMRSITGYGFLTEPVPKREVLLAVSKSQPTGYWEAPPEPMCIELLKHAITFLNSHSSEIIKLYSKFATAVETIRASGITRSIMSRRVGKVVGPADFSRLLLSIDGASDWKASPSSVAKLIQHVSAACFIVITFTCGPRMSELRRATSLSVKPRKHLDGQEYYYYYAPRSKTRYSADTNSSEGLTSGESPWVLSPAAVEAFKTLADLTAVARDKSGIDSLWLTTPGSGLWPFFPTKGFSIVSHSRMNFRLNEYAVFANLNANHQWQGLFHSHMGRKHLARFVAKRDRSALGDLAQQYSHLSADSIDISYARPDSEFRRMVQEELHEEIAQVAEHLLEVEPTSIYSAAADRAQGRITAFVGRLQSSRDIKLLISSGTLLMPCQWGVCLYRQETSACEGSANRPNAVNREPDVCASCSNFMATPKHKQWWQEHRADSIKVLAQHNVPAQIKAMLLSRLSMANSILEIIEVSDG